jgi:hypothetical protein
MDINLTTRLLAIFEEYPALEEKVMQMAPIFRNLTNPVLRKTVGKLASVEKVAKIGKLDPTSFLNALRQEAGLPTIDEYMEETVEIPGDAPDWISGQPLHLIDGTAMLAEGTHPIGLITAQMQEAASGKFILLQTNFPPLPLIEAMEKQDYLVFHKESEGEHQTFIGKK